MIPPATVSFPSAGTYVLRLTAFDGQLTGSDTVTAPDTVTERISRLLRSGRYRILDA